MFQRDDPKVRNRVGTGVFSVSYLSKAAETTVNRYDFLSPNHHLNLFSWAAICGIVIFIVLERSIEYRYRRYNYTFALAGLVQSKVDRIVSPFSKGVVAWGPDVTLQIAPDLREGWPLAEIQVRYEGKRFEIPPGLRSQYKTYFEEQKEAKRFFDDGVKFMLALNPKAFSDSPTLILELKKTRFSEVQFYRDQIASLQTKRDPLIGSAMKGPIDFPNAFCLHAVVVTRDDQILLTRRAPKVEYYPNTWSLSIEEQLSRDDLTAGNRGVVLRWGKRLLFEELGLNEESYDVVNLRILSAFLEGDILNCSLAAVFHILDTSQELSNRLSSRPRTDIEFTDWSFLSYHQVAQEIIHPSRQLMPTSGYRALLALVKHYGIPRLENIFSKIDAH